MRYLEQSKMCGFLIMIKITSRVWTFTYTSSECKCDVSSIDLIHLVVRNQVTSLGNVESNLLRVLKKIYGINVPSDAVKCVSDFTSENTLMSLPLVMV